MREMHLGKGPPGTLRPLPHGCPARSTLPALLALSQRMQDSQMATGRGWGAPRAGAAQRLGVGEGVSCPAAPSSRALSASA